MKFRPGIGPTAFLVFGLFVLLNLGFWQLRRNTETAAFVAGVHERVEGEPLRNADLDRPVEDLVWHRAIVAGQFTDAAPMLITGRGEFGEVGYDVVQPFQVDGGPLVLVNRGWVPRQDYEATLARVAPPAGRVEIEGLIYHPSEGRTRSAISTSGPSGPIPAGDDQPERWPPGDYDAMIGAVPGAAPYVLIAGKPLPKGHSKARGELPVTGYHAVPKTSPHLQYAATWFLIAATLVVIWAALGVQRGRGI